MNSLRLCKSFFAHTQRALLPCPPALSHLSPMHAMRTSAARSVSTLSSTTASIDSSAAPGESSTPLPFSEQVSSPFSSSAAVSAVNSSVESAAKTPSPEQASSVDSAPTGEPTVDLAELKNRLREVKKTYKELQDAIANYHDPRRKTIVLFGAGRSASTLIRYLLHHSEKENWSVRVADVSRSAAEEKIKGHPNGIPVALDVEDYKARQAEVKKADIVISLLPVKLHSRVFQDCIQLSKNMVTASYVSPDVSSMHSAAVDRDIILLNEVGLDPGIDHMVAMANIDHIRSKKARLRSFESFAGGLVAPESDDNPWRYKFTWNPRNVVLAGTGGVKFIQNGNYKYIPYHKVFERVEELEIPGAGTFEGYANRDSLKYRDVYDLNEVPTLYRGTLRRPGFSAAWNVFVQLGMTDDSFRIEDSEHMTCRQFINSFLFYRPNDSVELKLAYLLGVSLDSPILRKLKWLGIFENERIGLKNATPAEILQHILERKWSLREDDHDMIVMLNKFQYEELNGSVVERQSYMTFIGKDDVETAMAMTVGLPVGISTRMILNGKIKSRGVVIPTSKDIYEPVLKELEEYGIRFTETERQLYVPADVL
eukprot:CAMPEP_0177650314 /NCGR_PEP_ID=MMETSP0447-20121125/11875_1 /TAXON_ID=0 /ORGANISM="Stygamoeba regulata, Strain BSH-02190019" /LENGTH=595 /DNA_ID=CAMNT_0019153173 /DNA_START=17 /DNA_END=1804 /DNA_ORIENTATION=-